VKIGLLGTGNLALALGKAWAGAGHTIAITGRSPERAKATAQQIGAAATPIDPGQLAGQADLVAVAISWAGLEEALRLVGGPEGMLSGKTVIDCTNPVDYATGRIHPPTGSAAELVAQVAAGARVVKALHLFAGASWPFTGEAGSSPVVAICGDDTDALSQAAGLISDLGARSAVVGGLAAARQAEEAAGFVMRLVAAGANPRFAVPDVNPALLGARATDR
jgi:predicted dinucleotide-binding enzyme